MHSVRSAGAGAQSTSMHPEFMPSRKTFALTFFSAAALAANSFAGPIASSAPNSTEESVYDKIWGLTKFYENKKNPFIQSVRLTGRYHGQYHWTRLDTGDIDEWDNRRFRIGLEVAIAQNFLLKGEMVSGANMESFYDGFTELYLQWKPDPRFALQVGYQKPRFTYDWTTSSRYILTFERSMLLNQFRPDYAPGITLGGKVGSFDYYLGAFSNGPDNDVLNGFTEFNGGSSYIAQIGYDFAKSWNLEVARARLEYLYSDINPDSRILNTFEHGVAASLQLRQGRTEVVTELLHGQGESSRAYGLWVMPSYMITDKLQVVARYQAAFSDEPTGLAGQRRYERDAGAGRGDRYQAAYLGFNYYLYGHKLKLMGGVEYADMDGPKGYNGWTGLVGVRVFWGPESKGVAPSTRD